MRAILIEMAAKLVRHICISEVQPKHCTVLFTEAGLQQDWLSYLHEMLLVPVESCNGLPVHTCRYSYMLGKVIAETGEVDVSPAVAKAHPRMLS